MMAPKVRDIIIIWFLIVHPVLSEIEMVKDVRIVKSKKNYDCSIIRSSPQIIVKRFNLMLPFFHVDQVNSAFLQKFQALIISMFEGNDFLDKEAAFYAVILTPLLFLQKFKDSWCLLEKLHDTLQTFRKVSPEDKENYLKLLQNIRAMSQRVRDFIFNLPVNYMEYKETMEFREAETEKELISKPAFRVIETVPSIIDDRKKFELNLKAWSPDVMSADSSHLTTSPRSDGHIVNDLLRDFIMHQSKTKITSESNEGQENVKYVKQLLKSLG